MKMLTGDVLRTALVLYIIPLGFCSSLLCGRTKEVELGGAAGSGALVLSLMAQHARAPCQLRLSAPDAAAFTVRLIDVKESLFDWGERPEPLSAPAPVPGAPALKWGSRGAPAQQTTTDHSAPVANATDACKLLVFIGDNKNPVWKLSLCGANAAAVAARAGTKLLPPRLRIVWNPPTTPYHHTEKLRLVVTAVNSGSICNNDSQFTCGATGLCISSYLVCDGVRHCPGGEDEEGGACARRRDPPLLELLRRFAARNQELLGLDQPETASKPSVIMHITEGQQKSNALMEFAAALKPYGPWSYLVVGMLVCATILMFCLAWECCCKRSKPSDTPHLPASCMDLSPAVTVAVTSSSRVPSPPRYEPPPSYSELFPPRAADKPAPPAPAPQPGCSHQDPPD